MLLRSKARSTGKGKLPLLPKVKTRSTTKGKASSSFKQSEYCDGQCQQLTKKRTAKQKDKTSLKKHTYMSASKVSTDIGDELPTGGEQVSVPSVEGGLPSGSQHSEQLDEANSGTMPVTFDELTELLLEQNKQTAKHISEQNEHNAAQLQQQLAGFAKSWEKSQSPTTPSGSGDIKFPRFTGKNDMDVNDFISQIDLIATYKELNEFQKAKLLPVLLTGPARVWFSSATHLVGKRYDQLCAELVKQFRTESDIWLLKTQLANKRQLPGETVEQYASDIRKICQRLDLPEEQSVTNFLTGLLPGLKNYVVLQRPKTLLEAETHAKMKEALPDEKPLDRTLDEILKQLSQLKPKEEPKVAAYKVPSHNENTQLTNHSPDRPLSRSEVLELINQRMEPVVAAYNAPYTNNDIPQNGVQQAKPLRKEDITQLIQRELSSFQPNVAAYNAPFTSSPTQRTNYQQPRPLGREDITQIIRQELRRAKNQETQGQDYRNRRSFDGRPICNYCRKVGHVAYVCKQRQYDNRDPRIPAPENRPPGPNRRQEGNMGNPAPYIPQNLN